MVSSLSLSSFDQSKCGYVIISIFTLLVYAQALSAAPVDTDADGIPDAIEDWNRDGDNNPATRALDTDGDGTPDYRDTDSDGDGNLDKDERNSPFSSSNRRDGDGDGIPDVVDADSTDTATGGDSDGDGLTDKEECRAWPNCSDNNNNNRPDYSDPDPDIDNDGLCDKSTRSLLPECIAGPDTNARNPDVNNDGICDGIQHVHRSGDFRGCMAAPDPGVDTDNDGVLDENEQGDRDNDGIPDYLDSSSASTTSPGDSGIADSIDDKTECGSPEPPCLNSDGDQAYDYLDTDSDNDGVTDEEEADLIYGNLQDGIVKKPKDTDGDGIPNYRDTDSDNDGILDIDEVDQPHDASRHRDTDGDGIPNIYDVDDTGNSSGDSDGDGIVDQQECPRFPANCPDSDNDGIPDYMDNDTDADKDGIPDRVEDWNRDQDNKPDTHPLDTDGDGSPDYLDTDSDNDGLSDKSERRDPFDHARPRRDIDGDGIPDVLDADSTPNATQGGDSDNDGIADAIECAQWPACPDSDNDGQPDYADPDTRFQPPEEEPEKPEGIIKSGVSGKGSFGILLIPLALIMLRVKRQWLYLVVLLGANSTQGYWLDGMDLYAGAGLGRSHLTPETKGTSYSLEKKTHGAYKIFGGWDLSHRVSVEGYYSDLGDADLEPEGKLGYRMTGGSLVGQWWISGGERLPESIALYGKAGINHLTNKANNISYARQSSLQISGGIGAVYYLPKHFSVRLELESYDRDAALLSLNLVKRFGFSHYLRYALPRQKTAIEEFAANKQSAIDKEPAARPVPGINPTVQMDETPASTDNRIITGRRARIRPLVMDEDGDGILDDEDKCPHTPRYDKHDKPVKVDANGCIEFLKRAGQILFQTGSNELTPDSRKILRELTENLKQHKDMYLEVRAHTDNRGEAAANLALSQRRADAVVSILIKKGISHSRIKAVGYGESQPISDNATQAGRAKNRRVEFIASANKK